MHPHLSGDVREHLVAILEFDSKHGIRERFNDRSLDFDGFFLRHKLLCLNSSKLKATSPNHIGNGAAARGRLLTRSLLVRQVAPSFCASIGSRDRVEDRLFNLTRVLVARDVQELALLIVVIDERLRLRAVLFEPP